MASDSFMMIRTASKRACGVGCVVAAFSPAVQRRSFTNVLRFTPSIDLVAKRRCALSGTGGREGGVDGGSGKTVACGHRRRRRRRRPEVGTLSSSHTQNIRSCHPPFRGRGSERLKRLERP